MAELQLLTAALQYGPAVVLILGGMMEWYVWGPTYRRALQERDDWKSIALRSLDVAEKK